MGHEIDTINVYDEENEFKELMDQIMMLEGERVLALNEELINDLRFSVPEDVNIKCLKMIENAFSSE